MRGLSRLGGAGLSSQNEFCSMDVLTYTLTPKYIYDLYCKFKKCFIQIYSVVNALSFADRGTGTLLSSDFPFIL
jgi:hypothetical protein